MLKLFDYECPACGVFEGWGSTDDSCRCPKCGVTAKQRIGSRGILLSFKDEGFPRAYRMWSDHHEREARKSAPKDVDEYGY